jgi:hypothetical protein
MRTRLRIIAGQPRLALGALLTLLLAAGAVVGSGADFTATSASPSNTFAAGTLSIVNSREAQAVLAASGMRPGEAPTVGTVDIRNSGSLSGAFTLVRGAVSNSDAANPMAAKLNVTVIDCGTFSGGTPPTCDGGDPTRYTGTLAAMGTSSLGTYAPGEEHRYRFEVALDGSADNAYQGDWATVQFDFNAS